MRKDGRHKKNPKFSCNRSQKTCVEFVDLVAPMSRLPILMLRKTRADGFDALRLSIGACCTQWMLRQRGKLFITVMDMLV